MTRRRRWLLAGAGIAAIAAGWAWRKRQDDEFAQAPADVSAEFWLQRWPSPDGSELAMASLRGRPLIVNFWATWCPPCVRELPALDRLHRDQPRHGWQVLAIAVDEVGPVRQFLQRVPVTLPIALAGADGIAWSQRLGNKVGGLPFTVAIDAKGRAVGYKIGETSEEELRQWTVFSTTPLK